MRTARFEVYEAKDGWRWRLLAANNRQIAQGEAHTREADAWRAVDAVRKAVRKNGLTSVSVIVGAPKLTGKQLTTFKRQWDRADRVL